MTSRHHPHEALRAFFLAESSRARRLTWGLDAVDLWQGRVPGWWLSALAATDRGGWGDLVARWAATPAFAAVLSERLLGVAVAEQRQGPELVYLIDEREDVMGDGLVPAVVTGALPCHEVRLGEFERAVHGLPPALRSLWLLHRYLRVRDSEWIASLDPSDDHVVGTPYVCRSAVAGVWPEVVDDATCLEFMKPRTDHALGLVRLDLASPWEDVLVEHRYGVGYGPSGHPSLDLYLAGVG